ncbi:hypothetical protein F5Y02DRAFT_391186 [Annulohypoxylon stygium]|nr:hypothetical protein F5Y02DRAFT_391186 [Annulohypoxylon stygium]
MYKTRLIRMYWVLAEAVFYLCCTDAQMHLCDNNLGSRCHPSPFIPSLPRKRKVAVRLFRIGVLDSMFLLNQKIFVPRASSRRIEKGLLDRN